MSVLNNTFCYLSFFFRIPDYQVSIETNFYFSIFILWIIGVNAVTNNLFSLLTYTYNYASIRNNIVPNPVFQFWSLAVEEQFYLLWPFVIIPLRKKPLLLLVIIFLVVIVGYSQEIFSIFPGLFYPPKASANPGGMCGI